VERTNEGLVAWDTEPCRWQIQNSTKVTAVHPIMLVHQALGLSDANDN